MENLMFVFDRMPDQDGCVFVEVESAEGHSVCAGEWRERPDGLVELVVPVSYESSVDRVSAENLALQQRLTVQDQRVDELEGLLMAIRSNSIDTILIAKIDAALKPTAEAVSHE